MIDAVFLIPAIGLAFWVGFVAGGNLFVKRAFDKTSRPIALKRAGLLYILVPRQVDFSMDIRELNDIRDRDLQPCWECRRDGHWRIKMNFGQPRP